MIFLVNIQALNIIVKQLVLMIAVYYLPIKLSVLLKKNNLFWNTFLKIKILLKFHC